MELETARCVVLAFIAIGTISCTFDPPRVVSPPDPLPDLVALDAGADTGVLDGGGVDGGDTGLDADVDGGLLDGGLDSGSLDADLDGGPTDGPPLDAGQGPMALAGPDQLVCASSSVTLDGRGSSGDNLSFEWTQNAGATVVLSDPNSAVTSFTAPSAGPLDFSLTVSNDLGNDADTVTVAVDAPPIANAGTDQRVSANATVRLDGRGSSDDQRGTSFEWTQIAGPINVVIDGANTATASFAAPSGGSFTFLLELTDVCGQTSSDSVDIFVNTPPTPSTTGPYAALPFDTVVLSATTSTDADGDPLRFAWTLTGAPNGHSGGFAPYPGTGTATTSGSAATFYATLPGVYTFTLSVSDGTDTAQTSTELNVVAFSPLPYVSAVARDTRAIAVRPSDGDLFIGTRSNAGQQLDYDQNAVLDLACLAGTRVNALQVASDGRVYFGFDDDQQVTELAAQAGCVGTDFDPDPTLNPNSSRTRDLSLRSNDDFLIATDRDVAYFTQLDGDFTDDIEINDFGGSGSDFTSVIIDGSGAVWFGSRENGNNDGVARALDPSNVNPNTPRIDYFPGVDDRVEYFTLGLVALPATNELWISTRDRGILRILDVDSPASFEQYSIQNGGLPPALIIDRARRGELDAATEDVWIATERGVARYKRDVGVFVPLTNVLVGTANDQTVYDVAFDLDPSRGRTVYVATQVGVYRATVP